MCRSNNMIKNVLFIQPFEFFKKQLSYEILIWPIYLENFLKSKNSALNFDILYLPVEQKKGNLNIQDIGSNNNNFPNEMNKLIEQLEFQLDEECLICISGTTSNQFISSKILGGFFQKNYNPAILVFGGAHASACPNDFKYKGSPMDYIITGEGEIALYKLIDNNTKKQDQPKRILGDPLENLDTLPPLDFTLFDKYIKNFNHISISLSRGCPFNCRFCMEKTISENSKHLRRWRSYSPKRAIKEIKVMIEYGYNNGITEFGFYDPIFGLQKKWVNKLLDLFHFEEHKSIWLETRLDILNYDLLKRLQQKKFYLMYGLETFSHHLLYIMNKTSNPKRYLSKFKKIFKTNQELEYPYILNILFNHPGESLNSIRHTFEKINQLKSQDTKDVINYNIKLYSHFPGTFNYNHINKLRNKLGTINYIPQWWKTREFLEFGSFSIRPTKSLSLRASLTAFFREFEKFKERESKKISPNSDDFFVRSIIVKTEIQKLKRMEENLTKFLNKYKIELNET
ncbi:MAG: radical SAM protein [Promethearchaeia archaeon]